MKRIIYCKNVNNRSNKQTLVKYLENVIFHHFIQDRLTEAQLALGKTGIVRVNIQTFII